MERSVSRVETAQTPGDGCELVPISTDYSEGVPDSLERQVRRLAHNLHDGPLQSVTIAESMLDRAQESNDLETLHAQAAAAQGLLIEASAEIRAIMHELRPPAIDAKGLAAKISAYAQDFSVAYGIEISVHTIGQESVVSARSQVTVFRVVQECLTNARRHSGARHVDITLGFAQDVVSCSIADDGRGFDARAALNSEPKAHHGLRSMAERAALVGGSVSVGTAPGRGTVVWVWVPKDAAWM